MKSVVRTGSIRRKALCRGHIETATGGGRAAIAAEQDFTQCERAGSLFGYFGG